MEGHLLTCSAEFGRISPDQRAPVKPGHAGYRQGDPVSIPRFQDFPALPAGVDSPVDLPGHWFVARVQGQHEYRAVRMLRLSDPPIGYYVPLVKSRAKDPRSRVLRPLFPNNVFVCVTPEMDAYEALKRTESFSTSIVVINQERLIRELSAIHLATESGFDLRLHPGIVKGAKCVVIRGPMKFYEGIIEKIQNEHRVLLNVETLGRVVETSIPIEDVEPI